MAVQFFVINHFATGALGPLNGVYDAGIDTSNYVTDLIATEDPIAPKLIDRGTSDVLYGSDFRDIFEMHNGNDTAYGGLGSDIFRDFGKGNDTMFGGEGDDFFYIGAGNDTVHGGEGFDRLDYSAINHTVVADLALGRIFAEGIDTVSAIESITGSKWNDSIYGREAHEEFHGYLGNDKLVGRGGNDSLHGGLGNDKIYGDSDKAGDVASGDDRLFGNEGIDWLSGGLGDDLLDGGAGNDTLIGGDGADRMIGSGGNDLMTGGAGADTFVFSSAMDTPKSDRITDFVSGIDKIDLSQFDANPFEEGHQSFVFDTYGSHAPTVTGAVSVHPGPLVDGDTGHIDVRFQGGNTYVYLETSDNVTGASIVLTGQVWVHASDFIV